MPRFYCPAALAQGHQLLLPPGAARHAQVLRLQPGHAVTLFNGQGGEWDATIVRMGRSEVEAQIGARHDVEREASRVVHLAVGMPANERMDWLIEKAAELGCASIQPLVAERSVLRLSSERAARKQSHWEGVAVAACEQCGRNRIPDIPAAQDLRRWLEALESRSLRLVLSLDADAAPLTVAAADAVDVLLLSGPEGGLSAAELALAAAQGFRPVTLGPRTLRAETAPLAALAALTLSR